MRRVEEDKDEKKVRTRRKDENEREKGGEWNYEGKVNEDKEKL